MTSTQFEGSIKDTNVLRLIADYVPAKIKELEEEKLGIIKRLSEINNDLVQLYTHNTLTIVDAK